MSQIETGVGVALYTLNPEPQIAILTERLGKPELGKIAGDASIPMETLQQGETLLQARNRVLIEEMRPRGVDADRLTWVELCSVQRLGGTKRLITLAAKLDQAYPLELGSQTNEVSDPRWVNMSELARDINSNQIKVRCGAIESLNALMWNLTSNSEANEPFRYGELLPGLSPHLIWQFEQRFKSPADIQPQRGFIPILGQRSKMPRQNCILELL